MSIASLILVIVFWVCVFVKLNSIEKKLERLEFLQMLKKNKDEDED